MNPNEAQQTNKMPIVVVLIAVALLAGGLIGWLIGNSTADTSTTNNSQNQVANQTPDPSTKAAGVRVALNNALREHVSLGAATLRAAFNGDPNTEALLGTLDENSVEVAGLVGSVYGDEAEGAFLTLWRSHIGFFADYTTAAKAGNEAGMKQALADLAGYGDDAAAFFEGANPNLPATAVKPLLVEHRDLVIAAVNAWGAGDYEESYKQEQAAREQVGAIADALAGGIVKQMPDKF